MQLQHTCLKYMTSLSCVAFLSSTSPSTVVFVVVFSMQNILSTTLYHFLPARAEYIHTISKIPGPILSAASHLSNVVVVVSMQNIHYVYILYKRTLPLVRISIPLTIYDIHYEYYITQNIDYV